MEGKESTVRYAYTKEERGVEPGIRDVYTYAEPNARGEELVVELSRKRVMPQWIETGKVPEGMAHWACCRVEYRDAEGAWVGAKRGYDPQMKPGGVGYVNEWEWILEDMPENRERLLREVEARFYGSADVDADDREDRGTGASALNGHPAERDRGDRPAPGAAAERSVIKRGDAAYPASLEDMADPPDALYILGDPGALALPAIAIAGSRRAGGYGLGCAERFAGIAAASGLAVVNGGALGVDAAAIRAALEVGGRAVAVLAGGLDHPYPQQNADLFRDIVAGGGAIVSAQAWGEPPRPRMFRDRNRIVSALASTLLIIEAGLPSGTFSAAEAALEIGRRVLVVPGDITRPTSRGANDLILRGATPITDAASFLDAIGDIGRG